ncbi:ATP synthase subunit d [Hibiscus syriacus]|uniref:ATP synthase subunit d n=1 Tax=Hibiscus syriacus TaxID=106335 RepID=A0A6A2XV84_HIBSY|nr:ATP synthase subunit d [Hibiscus syriacus]
MLLATLRGNEKPSGFICRRFEAKGSHSYQSSPRTWRKKNCFWEALECEKNERNREEVVDVAFKASKNIDWEGMAKLLVSDEACKEFATIRRTFDEVNSTLQTKFSQVLKSINGYMPRI